MFYSQKSSRCTTEIYSGTVAVTNTPPFLLTLAQLAGKCHVYCHTARGGWRGWGVWGKRGRKVAYLLQLHRFKLSLPFNSFLPLVAVINLLLYKAPSHFPPYFRVAWDLGP